MIGNTRRNTTIRHYIGWLFFILLASNCTNKEQGTFSTSYFKIKIDNKGFITSMKHPKLSHNREFSPADKPSPLMCLYDSQSERYFEPIKATFNQENDAITLDFPNGSVAKIRLEEKTII